MKSWKKIKERTTIYEKFKKIHFACIYNIYIYISIYKYIYIYVLI